MAEYAIVGFKEVKKVLRLLCPYLRLKKVLARRVLALIRSHPGKMTAEELVRLSKLVDQTASFNYSKKRTHTCETIKCFLEKANLFPVETESPQAMAVRLLRTAKR